MASTGAASCVFTPPFSACSSARNQGKRGAPSRIEVTRSAATKPAPITPARTFHERFETNQNGMAARSVISRTLTHGGRPRGARAGGDPGAGRAGGRGGHRAAGPGGGDAGRSPPPGPRAGAPRGGGDSPPPRGGPGHGGPDPSPAGPTRRAREF